MPIGNFVQDSDIVSFGVEGNPLFANGQLARTFNNNIIQQQQQQQHPRIKEMVCLFNFQ
jgi:hypothetical protein